MLAPAADWSVLGRLREGANKEILGIIVSYKVKVKLVVSRGGSVHITPSSCPQIFIRFSWSDTIQQVPSTRRVFVGYLGTD